MLSLKKMFQCDLTSPRVEVYLFGRWFIPKFLSLHICSRQIRVLLSVACKEKEFNGHQTIQISDQQPLECNLTSVFFLMFFILYTHS